MSTATRHTVEFRLGEQTIARPDRPLVMGVLNITPDSFSDGNRFLTVEAAVDRFKQLVDDGAEIIDLGGESSRPGAEPIDVEEEWRRVGPVLAQVGATSPVPLSIDTYKAEIARRAVDCGVSVINDISALRFDAEMPRVVTATGATVVLMHMQGMPQNMQKSPAYQNVVDEVVSFLQERATFALKAGITGDKIIIDPGIGFGKTLPHNLQILNQLPKLIALGYPVLVGASRKSFIGKISNAEVDKRLAGSLAAALSAAAAGAHIIRVHDVRETRQALEVNAAITSPEAYV